MAFLMTFLGRVLAAWVAGACGWLAVKYGVSVDNQQQQEFVQHLVGIIIPLFLTLYSILHKLFDKSFNPGDAASTHIAAQEAREHSQLTR